MRCIPKVQFALAASALAFLAACKSKNPFIEHREALASAIGQIEADRFEQAAGGLEAMLAKTGADAEKFARQRYFAAYLLAQAHLKAAATSPFLKEATSSLASGIGGERAERRKGSATGHLVAAMMYASFAKDWLGAARGRDKVEDGEPVLPPSIADFEPQAARSNLGLCELVVQTQLGFRARAQRMLDEAPELYDTQGGGAFADQVCTAFLDRARFDPELRPWVYYALFEYLRTRDEPNAYRFGVLAKERSTGSAGGLDEGRVNEILAWIKTGSSFDFVCPDCQKPVVPEFSSCQNDAKPILDAFPVARQRKN